MKKIIIPHKPYIYIANHTSFLDIFILLVICKKNPLTFVSKKEVGDYPFIGYFVKKTHILVDRKDVNSRKSVYEQAEKFITKGQSICIFPEGGIFDTGELLNPFKDGAFNIALQEEIPILVHSIKEAREKCPNLSFKAKWGRISVSFLEEIKPAIIKKNGIAVVKNQSYDIILQQLKNYA